MAKKTTENQMNDKVTNDAQQLELIALNLIDQSPFQIRVVDTESEAFKELTASVLAQGLINPLTVRFTESTGRYELIAGHRRFRACEVAGLLTAPCYLLKVSDAQAEAMTCCENLNREDLLPIDEALTVKAMLDHSRTREEIAKLTGKSTRWVYRREAAARIPGEWQLRARLMNISAKFLEFAAAMDESTLNAIWEVHYESDDLLWADGGNLAMLEKFSLVAARNLNAAPWMGVSPEECNACVKRTDKSELVMDESCCCLDAECWKRHMDELADRTIAKCNENGIPVKRVTDEVITEMDVEEARSEEYDTCVLCSNASGAVEIYWGRSKPKSEKLQKKAAVKKPTEQNVFEMAYASEVLKRVENLVTSLSDLNGFLGCALLIGFDMQAFRPSQTKGFICEQRTRDVHAWMTGCWVDDEVKDAGLVFASTFQDCVIAELRNRLQVRNPLDTVSEFLLAQAVVCAFNMDPTDTVEVAKVTIKNAKKRK